MKELMKEYSGTLHEHDWCICHGALFYVYTCIAIGLLYDREMVTALRASTS